MYDLVGMGWEDIVTQEGRIRLQRPSHIRLAYMLPGPLEATWLQGPRYQQITYNTFRGILFTTWTRAVQEWQDLKNPRESHLLTTACARADTALADGACKRITTVLQRLLSSHGHRRRH